MKYCGWSDQHCASRGRSARQTHRSEAYEHPHAGLMRELYKRLDRLVWRLAQGPKAMLDLLDLRRALLIADALHPRPRLCTQAGTRGACAGWPRLSGFRFAEPQKLHSNGAAPARGGPLPAAGAEAMKPAESKPPPLTKEPEVVWSVISQVSTKAADRHIVVLHTPGTASLCARVCGLVPIPPIADQPQACMNSVSRRRRACKRPRERRRLTSASLTAAVPWHLRRPGRCALASPIQSGFGPPPATPCSAGQLPPHFTDVPSGCRRPGLAQRVEGERDDRGPRRLCAGAARDQRGHHRATGEAQV